MANPVVHFEVLGKDADGLKRFYSEAFGWEMQDVGEGVPYAMVARSDGGIGGGIGVGEEGYDGHVTFYVQVDDIEPALEKIKSLGGSPIGPAMDVPGGGRIALFNDPEGHRVGLFKPPAG